MTAKLNADNSGKLDITCRRGDSLRIKFKFNMKNEAGELVPVDLTGNTFTLRIYGVDSFPIVLQDGVITSNEVLIERTPEQMEYLKGVFYYEVKRDFGEETKKAIISGKLTAK